MKTNTLDFDAQALREKILDLAMRGKLVPQDPNDEPASVLLEKIKAEKEQLIKEKKIKKSKPLAPITDDEKPFDIPDSWEWVRLGDVITILRGGSPRPIKKYLTDDPQGINWIKIGDSKPNSKYIEYAAEKIIPEGLSKTRIVSKGDFLLSNSMSFGRPYILKINGAVHDGWLILSDYDHLFNKDYLYYLLSSGFINTQFMNLATGSTVKNLNRERVANTIAVVPPLKEQSRIAAKIAQLFALLRKVESSTQQYAKLQTLLKSKVLDLAMRGKLVEQDTHDEPASVLLEKIKAEKAEIVKEKKIKKSKPLPPITDEEKPFDIPDSWEWVRLGDVYHFVDYRGKTPHKISSGIRLITAKNVRNGYIKLEPEEFISLEEHKERSTRGLINKGDIFITTEAPMGLVALNNFDEPIATAQRLITLQKVSKYQDSSFAAFQMQSSFFQKELQQKATGSTVKGIKASNLKQVLILIPPLAEQRRTVKKISQVLKLLK
ncbi:restriction endonuclease S [Lactobacillus crispatus]|uniref:restriction endonuclease subunit S n=1 Tax=Lactobacillus crispatus TaxID=47770 RepID=UPI0018E3688F|nr:restriction endonuclease subunit S [Lactobacillus crispatus]MBI1721424.1 restriction endonuclease S [Lactobacillus crispatus]